MSFTIELCLDSLEACIAAEKAGAHRVELCDQLDIDGTTPSMELVRKVRDAISIDLHVLVRPRGGNFVYSAEEVDQMLENIQEFKKIGVNGIVSGALCADNSLDNKTLEQLVSASGTFAFTFHRAFDVCSDAISTYHALSEAGVHYLLSSGQGKTALDGIDLLAKLSQQRSSTQLMVGGKVNASNVAKFWNIGIRNFHFSCQEKESRRFDELKAKETIKTLQQLILK